MGSSSRKGDQVSDVQVERAALKVLDDHISQEEVRISMTKEFSLQFPETKLELLKRVKEDINQAIRNVYRDSWQQSEGEDAKSE